MMKKFVFSTLYAANIFATFQAAGLLLKGEPLGTGNLIYLGALLVFWVGLNVVFIVSTLTKRSGPPVPKPAVDTETFGHPWEPWLYEEAQRIHARQLLEPLAPTDPIQREAYFAQMELIRCDILDTLASATATQIKRKETDV